MNMFKNWEPMDPLVDQRELREAKEEVARLKAEIEGIDERIRITLQHLLAGDSKSAQIVLNSLLVKTESAIPSRSG